MTMPKLFSKLLLGFLIGMVFIKTSLPTGFVIVALWLGVAGILTGIDRLCRKAFRKGVRQ